MTFAATPSVAFDSDGAQLLGVLHLPAGDGPHPVAVILHGFPGNERNFDLAQHLRRCGYAALVFHYRGSWGVGGDWSWGNALQDAARVATAVRAPAFAAEHRLDPARLALVGHSLGGFVALMTAAADPTVQAVASIAAINFGAVSPAVRADPAVRASWVAAFDDSLLPLRGTSGEALVTELAAAGTDWDLCGLAAPLADRPVLLIGTGRDEVTPADVHHWPLVKAYEAIPALTHQAFDTDHALSDHRLELCHAVETFLNHHLRRPIDGASRR